jgi:hypothetical protein
VMQRAPAPVPVPVPAATARPSPAAPPIVVPKQAVASRSVDSSRRVAESKAFGHLRVRAFPADAEIRVDGRLLGQGVVVDSAVRAGARRLRVSAPGYQSFDTTVTVVADEITALPRITLPTQDPER